MEPSIEISNKNSSVDLELVNNLCGIFLDTCPKFIRELCGDTQFSAAARDGLATKILNLGIDYPMNPFVVRIKQELNLDDQLEILKELFFDADPEYIAEKFKKFPGEENKMEAFFSAMTKDKYRKYPKRQDYLRRKEEEMLQDLYSSNFTVQSFVKLIPDCETLFEDSKRNLEMSGKDASYAIVFLRNMFRNLHLKTIQTVFVRSEENLTKAVKQLREFQENKSVKKVPQRQPMKMPALISNIPLLQEIAYYSHESEIKEYLRVKREEEVLERTRAIENGTVRSCECCFDNVVLPRDVVCCDSGCAFCKSCVARFTEIRFSSGRLDFPCLSDCTSHFSLRTLETVIAPKIFSRISQRITMEEIKRYEIPGLEYCPFCDFATIPAEGYTVFTCLHPDCMKDSCRLCKKLSHTPKRCEELLEQDVQVRARIFVENQMTEALLRKCWKCGLKFYKEEGCNKMTCSCGAMMCYLCGKAVDEHYKHFRMNADDKRDIPNLCALNSDTNKINQQNVLNAAQKAKATLTVELKHDPSEDVEIHYKERAQQNRPNQNQYF